MRKSDVRFLTLCFILLSLLFFSFVHGVFRLQLFKHEVNAELLEKLQVETLRMAAEYQNIVSEAEVAHDRTLEASQNRSRLVVEQMAGLIDAAVGRNGSLLTAEEISELLVTLPDYNSKPENCFWIFNDQGQLVLGPRGSLTDVYPDNGPSLVESVRLNDDGLVSLLREDGLENPGYGRRVESLGWTLLSFQSWGILERKIQSFESLKGLRMDRLISQMGKNGSAGVVDQEFRFKEYTYEQRIGHHVDEFELEGSLPPSELLFNKKDGIREYVLMDPFSNHGKYRQAYMHYDEKTGNTYFIAQNKRELFKGIDQRSSPIIFGLGGLSLLLLIVSSVYGIWRMMVSTDTDE